MEGEHKNKWFIEVSVWDLAGEKELFEGWSIGPWDTEKIAKSKMREVAKVISDAITESVDGRPALKYIDMKQGGLLRSWEEN
jgi:hypothetical protein